MPNTHTTLTSLFSDIANAIRAKSGGTGTIVADTFPDAIAAIKSGGTNELPMGTGFMSVEPIPILLEGPASFEFTGATAFDSAVAN